MIAYLKENVTGGETQFTTLLDYSRVGNNLRFHFSCENSKLFSAYSEDNEPIYCGDVCEVFLSVDGKLNEYFEIEVAPNGTVFFAKILNDNGLKATFLKKNFKTSVTLTEKGYDVEIVIPYSSLGAGEHPIYFNAFRIETEGGIPDKNLLALSPTLKTTFHVPEKFILFPQD